MNQNVRRTWHALALCLGLALPASVALATTSSNVDKDREAIRQFAGCYEVSFDFAETFGFDPGYKIHAPHHSKGLEWITVDEDTPQRLSLQHVLVTSVGPMKHWRQEWIYEGDSLLQFRGNGTWEKVSISRQESAGRWIQRVFQVDDSPRYECSAPWVQWGTTRYWECQSWSPLPRREFSKRSDYNVLDRRNRQELTSYGWIHEQDNVKLIVADGKQTPIAKEKGENTYRKVDDKRCLSAKNFWTENRAIWHAILHVWHDLYARESKIQIVKPAGQPPLFEALFDLADRAAQQKMGTQEVSRQARAIIQTYMK
jgi:hypothetical protein